MQIESQSGSPNLGWRVTFAGLGINLALGILYTWSVISKNIPATWGWNESDKSWPYSVACLVFCLVMVPAGQMQDKIGPKIVATIGGILVGCGFILASFTTSLLGFIFAFGILGGAGIGFGYAACTPPAVKWFPAKKTGLIAGIVVSGFGLASVYAAPLTTFLISSYGFKSAMLFLGIAFLLVVVIVAQLLNAPDKPIQFAEEQAQKKAAEKQPQLVNYSAKQILSTPQFYMIWFMYACGAGAGLMIISKLAAIADKQVGISLGFVLVAVLAIGNGGGRILAGFMSDKLGRNLTMFICFVSQAVLIILISFASKENLLGTIPAMALISALIGANYGANLSLFPSITKDYYGAKNFGLNYGLVFTAWGIGGFLLSKLAGTMYVKYQTFNVAYFGASALLILAALMVFFVKKPKSIAL